VHSNDIFDMGRLWKKMPLTGIYFVVGGLALCGVWPFAGFFSKDEILIDVWSHGHPVAFWVLLITAGLTAFYMFRAFFTAFLGPKESSGHPHESPAVMTWPMGVLAVLAAVVGLGGLGGMIHGLMGHSISAAHAAAGGEHPGWIPIAGTIAALLGIGIAYLGYQARAWSPAAVHRAFGPVSTLLERRYYIDDFFEALYRWLYLGLGAVIGWFDRYVIDGLVNFATWLTWVFAREARSSQTGKAQDALYAVAIGLIVLAFLAFRL
jgi:NADH-quinone oxidoreductase subunit L